jgi:hypothetical protein
MWEMSVPVLSTSHIQQDTLGKLDPSSVAHYEEGAFVNLERNKTSLPAEWVPVRHWLSAHYALQHWIRFDRDGDEVDGLPTYNW